LILSFQFLSNFFISCKFFYLYFQFQKCESTVLEAYQNLFETYWYRVFHYDSQCFCECLYENVVNCQIMMVRKDDKIVENDIILHDTVFLNKGNLSSSPQNRSINNLEKTECHAQAPNSLAQSKNGFSVLSITIVLTVLICIM
jgi:hypothetical protein